MEASDKEFGDLKEVLKGNTSLMFSEVGNAPAKVIKDFRKKSDKPVLKGAYIEEAVYVGDDQIDAFGSNQIERRTYWRYYYLITIAC